MSNFTPQQSAAINGRGNLLVVAGAGTGKTHTLIARCLRLVAEERAALENILLVTFTEAAAAEMRARLRQELLKLHAVKPEDEHLAAQLALLDTARISTLHSFCLQLAREHFHVLGLDPQFGVLDERQTIPLQREALDEILEKHYSGTGAESLAVQQLIRTVGRGADKSIRAFVLKLHAYSQSLPDPAGWLGAQAARFANNQPDEWRGLFVQAVTAWRDEWLTELAGEFEMDDVPAVELSRKALEALPKKPSAVEVSQALLAVLEADAEDDNWPKGSVGKVRDLIKGFFDDADFLGALVANDNSDPLAEDWACAREQMTALVNLVREFSVKFAAKKRELGGVDFTDLEQLALRLLRERDIAAAWQQRLVHIFVDEYQDINAAQDAILTALSRDPLGVPPSGGTASQPPKGGTPNAGNRFLVGDVKQSIYRFRLANPKIFQAYQEQWSGRLPLTENFRSRAALLDFVNPLFASLMRAEVGGVGYEPLEFGVPSQRGELTVKPGDQPVVELHLITKADEPEAGGEDEAFEESDGKTTTPDLLAGEREARLVARRLRELHEGGHKIWDKEQKNFRAVKWSDMAVLLRSPSGRAEAFAMEFSKAGVPLSAARDGFFASLEVSDLLSLLKLLDNPLQDVPLAAVLRSPLVGLSPDELAELRASSDVKPFWTAIQPVQSPKSKVQSEQPPLMSKVAMFLAQFARWRELVRQTSLSQCLETALNETHYEALLLAEARGPERVANVRKLLDLARQFDPYQRQGLYRFLRFVRSQEDEELDLQPASPLAEDTVRLISIHKSKGLEFPVVALAGLGTLFNEQDLGAMVLVNETLGLCPKITPSEAEQNYPSLAHWLARRAERRELRGEELRLLYVALTRARDALILVGTSRRESDEVRWVSNPEPAIGTSAVIKARSHLDWLLMWLPGATAETDWLNDRKGANRLLNWKIYDETDPQFVIAPAVAAADDVVVRREELLPADTLPNLKARLDWRYPFLPATTEPAKASVTAIRRRLTDEAQDEAKALFRFRPLSSKPGARTKLSAAEVGLAHHLFLQLADLAKLGSEGGLRDEAARLRDEGVFTAEEFAVLDLPALAAFWHSAVGQKILAQSGQVHREIPFTARFSPAELAECGLELRVPPDDFLVVQGFADLAVILPKEIWLLDFKTDDVTAAELSEKVRLYAPQLKAYASALARIYDRPVRDCWLYFLATRSFEPVKV